MTEISLNRFLVLLLIGLALFDFALNFALEETLDEFYIYLVLLPVGIALFGRGGRIVYYSALGVCGLLGLLILFFVLILLMDITGFEPIDYDQDPIAVLALFIILIYGVVGVASFMCIRSSHPCGPELGELLGTIGELWVSLVFSILFVVTINFIIIIVALAFPGWGYAEIIWIYYLDTLAFLLVSSNAMMKLENFEIDSANNPESKPREVYRRESVRGYLMSGGLFMLVYAVLFAFVLIPPSMGNLFFVVLIALGFLLMHYNEFRIKLPKLDAESPNLEKLQQGFGLRLFPMHLTAMVAMLLLISDDKEMASLTLVVLFIFLKVTGDIIAEMVEFYREVQMIEE